MSTRKIIGFQLQNADCEVPEGREPHEVYPLSVVEKEQVRGYKIITIFEGDIENPTVHEVIDGEIVITEKNGVKY